MCFIATSNLLTRQLVNSSTRSYVTMSSSQATCLLVYLSTRQLAHSFLCYYVFLTSNLFTRQLVNSSPRQLNSSNPGSKLSSRDC